MEEPPGSQSGGTAGLARLAAGYHAVALVKVILTSYNRRRYLESALQSALAQTHRDFHIVLVDDASTDGAAAVASEAARAHPDRVTAICKSQRCGLTDSLNRALALRNEASHVAFLADDDLWAPTKLEAQMEAFGRTPDLGLVFTEALMIDEHGRHTGRCFSDVHGAPDVANATARFFAGANFVCIQSAVVSRRALELINFSFAPNVRFLHDTFLWLVIAAHFGIQYLPVPLTYYRQTPGALSSTRMRDMVIEGYEVRRMAFDQYPAVRTAVGGVDGLQILDNWALWRAQFCLAEGWFREYLWYASRALRRPTLKNVALLGWVSLRGLADALRGRHPLLQGSAQ